MARKILLALFVLAVIFFIDNLILIALGCTASLCGAENSFYCDFFCVFEKVLYVASIGVPVIMFAHNWYKQRQIQAN